MDRFFGLVSGTHKNRYACHPQPIQRVEMGVSVRQKDGNWLYSEVTNPEGSIEIASVVCRLSLSRIYNKVDFSGAE